jgi:hypothetical protein
VSRRNLIDRVLEVYTGPGPNGYEARHDWQPGQTVPVVIDGKEIGQIAVGDLLP